MSDTRRFLVRTARYEKGLRELTSQADDSISSDSVSLPHEAASQVRIAVPTYLGVRPLVEGLRKNPSVQLSEAPPSRLHDMLAHDLADVALLSTIDLQHASPPLCVLPAGCIAASGGTFSTRIFTRVLPEDIHVLWVDEEARTATALAKMLWKYNYARDLRIIPFNARFDTLPADAESALLVGDKVVSQPPVAYDRQVDISTMWFEMTGLPFVFAVWTMVRTCALCDRLYALLRDAREFGQGRLEEIAHRCAPGAGWPDDLAVRYLTKNLQFDFTEAHADGVEEFLSRAAECGLIDELRPLNFYPTD